MAFWKQLLLALVLLAVAAGVWAKFFPGAPDMLARWGIDWAPIAAAKTEPPAGGQQANRQRGGQQQGLVIAAPVVNATINDRLTAIGTGRANSSVALTPFATGRLVAVLVEPGARVAKGDVIARLDSETEQIEVDRARIAARDAQARVDRLNALRTANTATAVQVTDAELTLNNAKLALRDAELALQRRSIEAPISGTVGVLPVAAGNYVTTSTQIATIDDRSRIVVDFWVPERYATAIKVGAPLTATSVAVPNATLQGTISAIDNRIDEASRTLLVQAAIPNPDDTLRAGMSFQVQMRFPGDTFPSVSPLAIQWGTDGSFIWRVVDGKAQRLPVRIVQRNTESVLVQAEIAPGDMVVTEGIYNVREGGAVQIAGRPSAAPREAENVRAPAGPAANGT